MDLPISPDVPLCVVKENTKVNYDQLFSGKKLISDNTFQCLCKLLKVKQIMYPGFDVKKSRHYDERYDEYQGENTQSMKITGVQGELTIIQDGEDYTYTYNRYREDGISVHGQIWMEKMSDMVFLSGELSFSKSNQAVLTLFLGISGENNEDNVIKIDSSGYVQQGRLKLELETKTILYEKEYANLKNVSNAEKRSINYLQLFKIA